MKKFLRSLIQNVVSGGDLESLDAYILGPVENAVNPIVDLVRSLAELEPGAPHRFYSALGQIYAVAPYDAGSAGVVKLYLREDWPPERVTIPKSTRFVASDGTAFYPVTDYVLDTSPARMDNAGAYVRIDVWSPSQNVNYPQDLSVPDDLSVYFDRAVLAAAAPNAHVDGESYAASVFSSLEYPSAVRWVASVTEFAMLEPAGEGDYSPDQVYDVAVSLAVPMKETFAAKVRGRAENPNSAVFFFGHRDRLDEVFGSYYDIMSMEEINQVDYNNLAYPDGSAVEVPATLLLQCDDEIRLSIDPQESSSPCYSYVWIYPSGMKAERWLFGESGFEPGMNLIGAIRWDNGLVFQNGDIGNLGDQLIGSMIGEAKRQIQGLIREIREGLGKEMDEAEIRRISEQAIRALMLTIGRYAQ